MQLLLVLRLEGLLQSWGEIGKWNYRDSAVFPTKSGIVGLLGCALGWQRNDARLAELSQQLRMGARADRKGLILTDFHTVQSKHLLTALGKHRGVKGQFSTLVSHRDYLQDAYFTVVLQGEQKILEQIYTALKHPKWTLFLGRKSCVPSRPVYDRIYYCYQDIDEALSALPLANRASDVITVEIESQADTDIRGNRYNRNDALSTKPRSFFSREVIRKRIVVSTGGELNVSQQGDSIH